jgi:hypothetical protein
MSQKAQIRECTVEELYAIPAQPPQQPTRVVPITASRSATTSHTSSTQVSSSATPAPLTLPSIAEKTFLQKHALLITLTVVVAIGVSIYLYQRKKNKEKDQ